MITKFRNAVAASIALATLLTGCGENAQNTNDAKVDTVGFIYVGPIGDGGWCYAQNEGRLVLEKETGVKTIYKESVAEGPDVSDVMRNMIAQGADMLFVGSFGYMDYVEAMAQEYPNVKFLHCSGYKMNDKNFGNYFGRIYEARYLSGVVAAMKSKSNKIGYVAAFEIPEVVRGINAFTLGVRSVNPKAEVHVRWTHTWYDPAKEKEAALALLDDNCDVITQHQDSAGPQQAAESRGKFSIGYNSNMENVAPKAYMTAPIWNWAPYYIDQVKQAQAGTWKPTTFWGGMKDNTVMLAPLTKNAPEGAQEKVDAVKADIINGKFKVFAGPIKDQTGAIKVPAGAELTDKEMLTFNWFVEGVVGKLK